MPVLRLFSEPTLLDDSHKIVWRVGVGVYARRMIEGKSNPWSANELSGRSGIFQPGDSVDNRYTVEERLGAGGMGTVYRVTHLQTNCIAALKVLHPDRAKDPVSLRLFEQELRMSSIVGPNPHLVYVYDADVDSKRNVRYLVMNFIDGVTLWEYLAQWGPFPPEMVIILGLQCARAMKQVHEAGVVHRDLKPSNIFVTLTDEGKPHAMISDFGIAKIIEGNTNGFVTPVCTPAYAPPELRLAGSPGQTTPLPVSPATDIYSFGLILYEMLTGAPPSTLALPAQDAVPLSKATEKMPRDRTEKTPEFKCTISQACVRSPLLPEGSADWWKRCLQFNPADRWPNIEEAMTELVKLFKSDKRFSEMDLNVNYGTAPKAAFSHRFKRSARARLLPNTCDATTIPKTSHVAEDERQTQIRHSHNHKKTG